MEIQQRIEELRKQLHVHNYRYYVCNDPVISDMEFDQLMAELLQLETMHPEFYDPNSPTQRVGSDLNEAFTQVSHRYPMLSLANTYNAEEVSTWYNNVKRDLGNEPFEVCCELKFDGLSISLSYEDSRFVRAVTRGDGSVGDDVSANVRTIKTLPLVIPPGQMPTSFEIRGEILMPWKVFDELNALRTAREESLFANPRNAAAGTLKSQNSRLVAERKLDAYLYDMPGDAAPSDDHYHNLCIAREAGFKVSEHIEKADSLDAVLAYIEKWDEGRKYLPVATDGVVLKVNSLRQRHLLGTTSKSPKWAIAYKFKAERECTQLESVSYQVGRTGAVTPVANMTPVLLAGTTVKRATLNNEDFIRSLDLHIGDYVYVEKGGEIIPKIVGVDKSRRQVGAVPVVFPTYCPECGTTLCRTEGEAALYCPNDSQCKPQILGRIEHFISRKAMDIDSLGPETITDFYERGLIKDVADLYVLTVEQIDPDGNRRKSARKIVQGIEKSKQVPFQRLLFALGIRFVGEISARLLARHFLSMSALQTAEKEELMMVEGVGEVMANSVWDFFHNETNLQLIDRLKQYGLQMEMTEVAPMIQSDKLSGKNIVVSGVFSLHSREEYKAMIEQHGGKNTSSINGKTAFLLAGDKMGPSKLEKAKSLNISIIDEQAFLEMLK